MCVCITPALVWPKLQESLLVKLDFLSDSSSKSSDNNFPPVPLHIRLAGWRQKCLVHAVPPVKLSLLVPLGILSKRLPLLTACNGKTFMRRLHATEGSIPAPVGSLLKKQVKSKVGENAMSNVQTLWCMWQMCGMCQFCHVLCQHCQKRIIVGKPYYFVALFSFEWPLFCGPLSGTSCVKRRTTAIFYRTCPAMELHH